MYERAMQTTQHSRNRVATDGRINRSNMKPNREEEHRNRIRSIQLLVCLLLFFLVALGNGACPEKMLAVRERICTLTTRNMDLHGTLMRLEDSLTGEGAVIEELSGLYAELFVPTEQQEPTPQTAAALPEQETILSTELKYLHSVGQGTELADHYLYPSCKEHELPTLTREMSVDAEVLAQTGPEEAGPAVPEVGAVLLDAQYSGKALPANYTMDHLSLGCLETVTPVMGNLNSEYGYRDHPINGKYLFHGGVDIGGQKGDPILAFASGAVEYVGENNSYGLYLQLDHGNGIKSFYAHCKKICVTKGQTVALGDKIAEVGSSGSATGPHLHFELKCNGVHLDPRYYIKFLNA